MSKVSLSRRSEILLKVNGGNSTAVTNVHLLSFVYADNYDDKCDDLRIELDDREGTWIKINKTSNSTASTSSSFALAVGDTVMVKNGAKDWNGGGLASFVYSTIYTVLEIGKANPNRIVIGLGNAVTAAVDIANLIKSNGSEIKAASSSGSSLKGSTIEAVIIQRNRNTDGSDTILNCGTFQVDSVNYSSPPAKIKINATSLSLASSAGIQKKTQIWENIGLINIVRTVASRNGFSHIYESAYNPMYERKKQDNEGDVEFVQRLCSDAGISVKFMNNMIVLFDEAVYENKAAVYNIDKNSDIISCNFYDNLNDTAYSSCHVSYTGTDGLTYEYTYTPRNNNPGTGLVLEISEKVSSTEEARQLAMKRLRQKNKGEKTASFRLPGNASLVAGITINVSGFGDFNGKYMVERAEHSVHKTSGYTTTLEMHKVLEGY